MKDLTELGMYRGPIFYFLGSHKAESFAGQFGKKKSSGHKKKGRGVSRHFGFGLDLGTIEKEH